MNRAISAASEGFVESIQLALTLPAKILSVALSVLFAFVHHEMPPDEVASGSGDRGTH
jgi:hypothetical protein